MNFLSHYFIEEIHTQPYFLVGLSVPDMWHEAGSLHNPILQETDEENLKAFKQGLQRHILADKVFHNSDYFKQMNAWLKVEMAKLPFSASVHRKFFLAHILIELMLDRILMNQYPNLLNQYYAYFDQINPQTIQQYMQLIYHDDFLNLDQRIERFRTQKRLEEYKDTDKLADLLGWLMEGMAKNPPLSIADKSCLKTLIVHTEQEMLLNYATLFTEMEIKMNES